MIEQVTPGQLPAWFEAASADGAPLLLDVREPAEWQAASVRPAGAELLQMSMQTLPARLAELDPDRPVAVLCHHGGRSMQVAMFLAQHGFERVANVAGGIDAWALPVDPSVPRY
ncbi:sulfurtransferase [Ottowia sp. GY511]|uniref:Rhodanese-like domain-containing protein n=1 Tax=Ottowia flava TaxID=2675430 RepID=A0ABW4KYG1_9BURK|nr:rhodanese-like domain-containing protein [Ottowia sp. GY511]TXK26829.1 sulfurtransferase [Ottowia sp. GY511]